MQRASWNLLRNNWADKYFFEPLSEFLSRLHEDRGGNVEGVVMFSPEGEEVPPPKPPVFLLVLYKEPIDFLSENLFLRERDPSGMFNFFCYQSKGFKEMLNNNNPIARQALSTGIIVHETENTLEEFIC